MMLHILLTPVPNLSGAGGIRLLPLPAWSLL